MAQAEARIPDGLAVEAVRRTVGTGESVEDNDSGSEREDASARRPGRSMQVGGDGLGTSASVSVVRGGSRGGRVARGVAINTTADHGDGGAIHVGRGGVQTVKADPRRGVSITTATEGASASVHVGRGVEQAEPGVALRSASFNAESATVGTEEVRRDARRGTSGTNNESSSTARRASLGREVEKALDEDEITNNRAAVRGGPGVSVSRQILTGAATVMTTGAAMRSTQQTKYTGHRAIIRHDR